MSFERQLYVPGKREYIRGKKRPPVDCILCSILAGDPLVERLLIWDSDLFAVSANLYPYNPGHLLIFPRRHILDPRELTADEISCSVLIHKACLDALDAAYQPAGFNLGANIGEASGASIKHFHTHIVPRYQRELGFVDICAGAKIMVEDPHVTMEKLRTEIVPRLEAVKNNKS